MHVEKTAEGKFTLFLNDDEQKVVKRVSNEKRIPQSIVVATIWVDGWTEYFKTYEEQGRLMGIDFNNPEIEQLVAIVFPDDSPIRQWTEDERKLLMSCIVAVIQFVSDIVNALRD